LGLSSSLRTRIGVRVGWLENQRSPAASYPEIEALYSEKAVWYAAKLASGYDATLHLLHVFQTPFHGSVPYQGTRLKVDQIKSYASAAEQQVKEDLDELLGQLQKRASRLQPICNLDIHSSKLSKRPIVWK